VSRDGEAPTYLDLGPPHNTYITGQNSSYRTPNTIKRRGVDVYDGTSTTTSESHGEDDAVFAVDSAMHCVL